MFEDFNYNCPHLPNKNDVLSKDQFEKNDYAFNKYFVHARDCSFRFIKHALAKLMCFRGNKDVKIMALKDIFEKFRGQFQDLIRKHVDDTDPFAKHFVNIINLLTIFINSLINSNNNIISLKSYLGNFSVE
jgi:hypothetical protein